MTIRTVYIASCDECESDFEDGTEYSSVDDLEHDMKAGHWESDGEHHRCSRCIRAEEADRPYQGPIPHGPPSGFVNRAMSWD